MRRVVRLVQPETTIFHLKGKTREKYKRHVQITIQQQQTSAHRKQFKKTSYLSKRSTVPPPPKLTSTKHLFQPARCNSRLPRTGYGAKGSTRVPSNARFQCRPRKARREPQPPENESIFHETLYTERENTRKRKIPQNTY